MSSFTLLPNNSTAQERHLETVTARLDDIPVVIRELWRADTCPDDLLPWLARAVSVDVWDPAWSPEQKRGAIRNSINVHRHKGTIGAVRDALAGLGFTARIQEWFNQIPQADPYTYRLLLESDQVGYSLEDIDLLLEVVGNSKNLRSHLTEIVPIVRTLAGPVMVSVASVGSEVTIAHGDQQSAAIIPGFLAAEAQLDTLINTALAESIGV